MKNAQCVLREGGGRRAHRSYGLGSRRSLLQSASVLMRVWEVREHLVPLAGLLGLARRASDCGFPTGLEHSGW